MLPVATMHRKKSLIYISLANKDFNVWINDCAVCHQYRTVGVMAPMRSTLASLDEFDKLPWRDVIIDCQGPFTRSGKGNHYIVSYHCTFLGIPKLEPFARLRKEEFLVALVAHGRELVGVQSLSRVADKARRDNRYLSMSTSGPLAIDPAS